MNTSNTRTEPSLTQLAQQEFDQCRLKSIRPLQTSVQGMRDYKDSVGRSELDPVARVGYNYSGFALATIIESPDQRFLELREWGRKVTASVVVALSVASGNKNITLDSLLGNADREEGSTLNDMEAMHAVEECGRKTQEAEKQVVELVRAKEEMELAKMQLEETVQSLSREKQQLQEELTKTKQALSDAHAQVVTVQSNDPVVVAVAAELKKFQTIWREDWIAANRQRVCEQHAAADKVEVLVRMMQEDPAIVEAVKKNRLISPAFDAVVSVVKSIPA